MHPLILVALFVVALPAGLGRAATVGSPAARVQATPPAQQPPAPQQQPQTPAPAKKRPARQPSPASGARTTLEVEVTKASGEPLEGVTVRASGPVEREEETNASGQARLINVRPGIYRLRFEVAGYVTFEREVTVPASGRPAPVEVALDAAPAPPAQEPVPPAQLARAADAHRPVGDPATLDVTSFIERNFIGRSEPQKISVLGCTGYATTRLLQVREPLADRVHADADETLFVVAGEASITLGGREQSVQPNGLVVVPRGTEHTIVRHGRNPAILLSVLSGPPCSEATK